MSLSPCSPGRGEKRRAPPKSIKRRYRAPTVRPPRSERRIHRHNKEYSKSKFGILCAQTRHTQIYTATVSEDGFDTMQPCVFQNVCAGVSSAFIKPVGVYHLVLKQRNGRKMKCCTHRCRQARRDLTHFLCLQRICREKKQLFETFEENKQAGRSTRSDVSLIMGFVRKTSENLFYTIAESKG